MSSFSFVLEILRKQQAACAPWLSEALTPRLRLAKEASPQLLSSTRYGASFLTMPVGELSIGGHHPSFEDGTCTEAIQRYVMGGVYTTPAILASYDACQGRDTLEDAFLGI
jgi:hypothetical protein